MKVKYVNLQCVCNWKKEKQWMWKVGWSNEKVIDLSLRMGNTISSEDLIRRVVFANWKL